ncbi:hypothetical protein [Microbulbifer sp. HZ11]|uniref:hypothetical protein n=1 Tax=unclassified Microbulbifer TaxID=2619833 RepID=UPI0012DEF5F1|nr:hypothetical protein [Microbulbifer sp. HZ11]
MRRGCDWNMTFVRNSLLPDDIGWRYFDRRAHGDDPAGLVRDIQQIFTGLPRETVGNFIVDNRVRRRGYIHIDFK